MRDLRDIPDGQDATAAGTIATMGLRTEPSVRDYVLRLDRALVGPRRAKRDLLDEVVGHLEDAVDAYAAAGYDGPAAARLALDDFGAVAEVAPAFQSTLAVASSRRTAWTLLVTLLAQPFLWDGGIDLASSAHAQAPDGWVYALLDRGIEAGGGLVLLLTVVALLVTGVGHRWLRVDRLVARVTAWFTIGAAVFVPATGVSMTLMSGGQPTLWLLIGVLLVLPMALTALSARRTLAAC